MNIFGILVPKQMLTYLTDKDPVDKALEFLLASGFTAVPVIDEEGRYVGIASEGDFLRMLMEHGKEELKNYVVGDFVNRDMSGVVLNTVGRDEIMEKILDRNFLSIVDDRQCFIGIITRKSVIMYLAG